MRGSLAQKADLHHDVTTAQQTEEFGKNGVRLRALQIVRFGSLADIARGPDDVRITPNSGQSLDVVAG